MSHDPRRDPTDPPPKRVLGAPIRQSRPEILAEPEPVAEPTPTPTKPSMMKEWGALVAAIFAGLTSVATAIKPPPTTATDAEMQKFRTEIAEARQEFIAEAKATREQMEAQRKLVDSYFAGDAIQDKQIVYLAEFAARLNGGLPSRTFPEPSERDWYVPRDPPPQHRTDRVWPEKH